MIFYLFVLFFAIGFATLGCFTFWPIQQWYNWIFHPILLFIFGYVIGVAILWIFLDIAGRVTVKKGKEYDTPTRFHRFLINNGMAYIRRLAHIIVKVKGQEKVPATSNVLLVCNHRSNFDNFLLSEKMFMHKHIAFISKPNNFKLPLAGRVMQRLGYLSIQRDDLIQSLETMKKASQRLIDGKMSIGVFPEGTRSKDGKTMGEFHEGVFNIAVRAKAPIVVCSICGTENVVRRYPRFTKVNIHVLQVLNYDDYAGQPAKQISENVKAMIQADLDRQEQNEKE